MLPDADALPEFLPDVAVRDKDSSEHGLRNMAFHRRRRGSGGVKAPRWLTHHFRGEPYRLGPLQFGRARLGQRTRRPEGDWDHLRP
ncbi:hypothetical protein [Streptomyces sp. NPDC058741]|uniref:hypothetical protein n=1 Tax=unclassified Streptomyces TaxID=2593676 RepID=UPI003674C6F8